MNKAMSNKKKEKREKEKIRVMVIEWEAFLSCRGYRVGSVVMKCQSQQISVLISSSQNNFWDDYTISR